MSDYWLTKLSMLKPGANTFSAFPKNRSFTAEPFTLNYSPSFVMDTSIGTFSKKSCAG